MSYKVIEKNEYGIRVRNYSGISDCNLCKNVAEKSTCKRIECAPNSYYLPDSEVEKLEYESETQKELLFLQIENKQLKDSLKELEQTIENMKAIAGEKIEPNNGISSVYYPSDNETKVDLFFNDGIEIFECLSCGMLFEKNEPYNNYCPNCGRKILR